MTTPLTPLRVIFFGTADLAATVLRSLCQCPHVTVVAAVSQPDKPRGRDLQLHPTPVKRAAEELQLPILQPARAKDPALLAQLAASAPDLLAVAAYGQILPGSLLQLPRFGALNVHTSLLPRYRGAAPIQWALIDGLETTGVTIMKMDVGLDTGDIVAQETVAILPEDDAQTLHDRLAAVGAALLPRILPAYAAGELRPYPQPTEGVSYARKLTKDDGRIGWTESARSLWFRIRGLSPWPGAFTYLPDERVRPLLKLWGAQVVPGQGEPGTVLSAGPAGLIVACGDQALRFTEVQREGGRRLPVEAFLRGCPIQPGARLSDIAPAQA